MTSPVVRRRLFISGQVQGVWFRRSTKDEADRIGGLQGFVRNLVDGRVEAVIQGEAHAVERLVRWCHEGPRNARVEAVEVVVESAVVGERPFHVER